ncbi:MAG: hypothetical protein U9Q83_07910 [Bacteroidota bacterium]|nr:hypothetical protein [Bacteroidota bacterium]
MYNINLKIKIMKLKYFLGIILVVVIAVASTCQADSNELDDKRTNIADKWHCTLDDGSQVPEDFEVEITKDATVDDKVYISNFINNETKAYATMTGFNLTVPEQIVGNATVSATGTVATDYQKITWDITINGDSYTAKFVPGGITKKNEVAR